MSASRDLECVPVLVRREVLDRPAERDQCLLERPARGCGKRRLGRRWPAAQQLADRLGARDLGEQRRLFADEPQQPGIARVQPQPPVAGAQIAHVGEHRLRDLVPGQLDERGGDLVGAHPRGRRVPQRDRRDPVRVHVLGALLELGETRERCACPVELRVRDLEQHAAIALDDGWT